MPRYEYRQGTSSKFWEIEVEGSSYTTTYGKIGADGKATTKEFDGPEKAQKEAEKQIASKVKKGYVLVEGEGAPATAADGAGPERIVGLEKENTSTAELAERFLFRPVVNFDPEKGLTQAAKGTAYRVHVDYDNDRIDFPERLDALLKDERAGQLQALVIGAWISEDTLDRGSGAWIASIHGARERLASLVGLFLADVPQEQQEISWINLDDWSALLELPALEHLRVRVGEQSGLGPLRSPRLRSLVVQSGGCPANVLDQVGQADLPALEHLELWLGTDDYGGPADAAALAPLLSGKLFPQLRYLGLRNAQAADALAAAVASSPLLERIQVLDMSLGAIGDEGAEALLASPALAKLERLDLHHNFIGAGVAKKLKALKGVDVDVRAMDAEADEYGGEVHRYISVSE